MIFLDAANAQSANDNDLTLREIYPVLSFRGATGMNAHKSVCAAGRERQRALNDISVYAFCREVIEQIVSRNLNPDWEIEVPRDWSIQYPADALAGIKDAALKNATNFTLRRDQDGAYVEASLNCPTAYDAGFSYGYTNFDAYGSQTIPLDSAIHETHCHAHPTTSSTKNGFLLGLRDGIALGEAILRNQS